MANLYLLMGIPGAGKSFFAQKARGAKVISRDTIRFSLISEDDDYFSKENKVFKEFVKQINQSLAEGNDTIADATHITRGSRMKLLRRVDNTLYDEVYIYWLNTPLRKALERNSKREGRSKVPVETIKNMYSRLEEPIEEEGFNHVKILEFT